MSNAIRQAINDLVNEAPSLKKKYSLTGDAGSEQIECHPFMWVNVQPVHLKAWQPAMHDVSSSTLLHNQPLWGFIVCEVHDGNLYPVQPIPYWDIKSKLTLPPKIEMGEAYHYQIDRSKFNGPAREDRGGWMIDTGHSFGHFITHFAGGNMAKSPERDQQYAVVQAVGWGWCYDVGGFDGMCRHLTQFAPAWVRCEYIIPTVIGPYFEGKEIMHGAANATPLGEWYKTAGGWQWEHEIGIFARWSDEMSEALVQFAHEVAGEFGVSTAEAADALSNWWYWLPEGDKKKAAGITPATAETVGLYTQHQKEQATTAYNRFAGIAASTVWAKKWVLTQARSPPIPF